MKKKVICCNCGNKNPEKLIFEYGYYCDECGKRDKEWFTFEKPKIKLKKNQIATINWNGLNRKINIKNKKNGKLR